MVYYSKDRPNFYRSRTVPFFSPSFCFYLSGIPNLFLALLYVYKLFISSSNKPVNFNSAFFCCSCGSYLYFPFSSFSPFNLFTKNLYNDSPVENQYTNGSSLSFWGRFALKKIGIDVSAYSFISFSFNL